jgi:2-phosphoglycerate kinase
MTLSIVIGLVTGVMSSFLVALVLHWLNINANEIFINLHMKIPTGFLVFITGTNGVGKTTTALMLAKKLGIRYIEVNTLREALRSQKELYEKAKQKKDYDILSLPTYMLDNIEYTYNEEDDTDYEKQCSLMNSVIHWVASYCTRKNMSTVFEGINISPQKVLSDGTIAARYILFVELSVSDKNVLLKRLDKKAKGRAYDGGIYHEKIDKIMNTAKTIAEDFNSLENNIHKLSIDNTDLSPSKVTNKIVREIKEICKQKKK